MKFIGAALALLTLFLTPALAQPAAAPGAVFHIALIDLPAKGGAELTVTTPAFVYGGDFPFENDSLRGSHFPGLDWSQGPTGTKSYAVIMQDSGFVETVRTRPLTLHWTMFNIPANVTHLAPDMTATTIPPGASLGPNARGKAQPYMGPGPPPGPRHVYHLQVFALDTTIPPDQVTDFNALTAAMKGHVLASGRVVGLGAADPQAPPRPAQSAATPAAPAAK